MDEFLNNMMEILDTENQISMDTRLESIEEWDSLSIVSFLAMADVKYSKQLKAESLKNAETIFDLYELLR